MVLSMAVLLVPICLLVWFFTIDPKEEAPKVDISSALAQAEKVAPYPILRAKNLPAGWTPTRVRWVNDGSAQSGENLSSGAAWLVGYLGPDGYYYSVQQSDREPAEFIAHVTRRGRPTGETYHAIGMAWQRYESSDGRTKSLVCKEKNMVAIVSSDSGFPALDAFTTSLATR